MTDIKSLFRNAKLSHHTVDYNLVKDSMGVQINAMARVAGYSMYVIDYYKRLFSFVSSNPLFLCGHTPEEVIDMEFSFFEKIMPPEDFELFQEINEKGIDFYNAQPIGGREVLMLSFDLRLIHPNNRLIYVNFKVTPLTVSSDGHLWLSLGLVSLSSQKTVGNAYIINENSAERYEYSPKSKKWNLVKNLTLTAREKEILIYSAQGFTNEQIAQKLFLDVNTIKFHKRKVFDKFGVKNIIEAIRFAYNYKLI